MHKYVVSKLKKIEMFNIFRKSKSSSSKVPNRIQIMRMEDYHTHYLGKLENGKLFFGYETWAFKKPLSEIPEELKEGNRIDFSIVYLFNKKGEFLEHKFWSTELENERYKTSEKLEELIAELGKLNYCDIEVELFELEINGIKFGLIPNGESIDLQPSSTISFQEPWDGEYYT